MTDRPEWCPESVWEAVNAVGELTYGRHSRGFIMWPLCDSATLRAGIARAIFVERERCARIARNWSDRIAERIMDDARDE